MKKTNKTLKVSPKKLSMSAPVQEVEYQKDFFKWTKEQAFFLKNQEFNKLDIANLIEEIESLGRSEKRTLKSYLEVLLMHLLKMVYQPKKQSKSWILSIKNSRKKFKETLKENPSLKPKLAEFLKETYESSRWDAALETGLDESAFPEKLPWTVKQILDDNFFGI